MLICSKSFFEMKIKDYFISTGSFILGCVITVNFLRLDTNDMAARSNCESRTPVDNIKDTKLYSAINYFLIIMIISGVDHFVQRNAIRESWGLMTKDYPDVQYFFIIGSQGLSSQNILKLKNEQIKYNDLFLMSVEDNYRTLTKKVLSAFVWFDAEFNFKYILKCDDDSFVVIPKLVEELQNNLKNYDNLYWGYFDGRAHIKKLGKWKESEWFLCDRYLPYALGGGYVLSRPLVQYIKHNEHLLGTYLSEDISVGTWLSPLNITRYHDVRFDTEYLSRGCNNSHIVTHKQTPSSMRTLYSHYMTTGQLCDKETKTRMSYNYNWNVLPTKCCIPNELSKTKKN